MAGNSHACLRIIYNDSKKVREISYGGILLKEILSQNNLLVT